MAKTEPKHVQTMAHITEHLLLLPLAKASIRQTKVWLSPEDVPAYEVPVILHGTLLEVTPESSVDAVFRLSGLPGAKRVAVLNFASATRPGGGFLRDTVAQEEDLCRASCLYPVLSSPVCAPYYEQGRASVASYAPAVPGGAGGVHLYTDALMYHPAVPFFRVREPAWVLADVVTCAAPDLSGAGPDAPPASGVRDALRVRAELILRACLHHQVTDLVLGAWGCGVFRNDPQEVAGVFRDLLGAEYRHAFRRVCFAVWDPTAAGVNYVTFRDTFKDYRDTPDGATDEPPAAEGKSLDDLRTDYLRLCCDRADLVDPDDEEDWVSLALGFALARGFDPEEARRFVRQINYGKSTQ